MGAEWDVVVGEVIGEVVGEPGDGARVPSQLETVTGSITLVVR